MEKTPRNVGADSDKFALLRRPETQNLLATARWLMRLTLKPSFEVPGSVTPGPAALTGIVHRDRTYRIKGPLVIAPRCLLSKVWNEV
jgi:hypothetical protein